VNVTPRGDHTKATASNALIQDIMAGLRALD